jgi:cobalt/nickel transport system permease protein
VKRAPRRSFVERTIDLLLGAMERAQAAERSSGGGGLLQQLDPRVKVVGLLALVFAVVLARNAATIAAIFAVALVAAVGSRVKLSTLAAGVWIQAFIFTGALAFPALVMTPGRPVVSAPPLPWSITEQGLTTAGYLLARVETAATLAYLLVATTSWMHVLKALRVLRVPLVVVVVLGMTYRYILLMLEAAHDMFEAHRARAVSKPRGAAGAQQAAGSAAVLLSKTMGLSDEVFLAMRARGFRGEVRVLDEFRMASRDWVALASFAALTAAAVWAGR